MTAKRYRAYTAGGELAFEGDVPKHGRATVKAGKTQIERVVFYSVDGEDETVVGSVDVKQSGTFTAELPAEGDAGDEG